MTHLGQISIMHIILICKLIAKVQKTKVDQNSTKLPQNHKKHFAGSVATPPPHLSLTMSSLGAKEPPCQQNTKSNKLDNKIQNKDTTKNKRQYAQR